MNETPTDRDALAKSERYMATEDSNPLSLRSLIERKAKDLDITDNLQQLSDIASVRAIQEREGHTQCFAREIPLYPRPSNPAICDAYQCVWRTCCDAYRAKDFLPIDLFLANEPRDKIEAIRTFILAQVTASDHMLKENGVGVRVRSFDRISNITRKMLLTTPKTVVAESIDDVEDLERIVVNRKGRAGYDPRHPVFIYTWDVVLSRDFRAVLDWAQNTTSFFNNGNLSYAPLWQTYEDRAYLGREYMSSTLDNVSETVYNHIPPSPKIEDLKGAFEAPHLGLPDGSVMLTNQEFGPILNITLPFIDGVDFNTLFKLMSDFPEELCAFRDFLYSKVEGLRLAAVGSENFYKNCSLVEAEIRNELRGLKLSYKKSRLQAAFTLTGCAIASWTLALYCLTQGRNNLLTILGPGGIAYKISESYSTYLISQLDLKNNPAYFLWVIGKSKGSF